VGGGASLVNTQPSLIPGTTQLGHTGYTGTTTSNRIIKATIPALN
jgi:hypothetical protein